MSLGERRLTQPNLREPRGVGRPGAWSLAGGGKPLPTLEVGPGAAGEAGDDLSRLCHVPANQSRILASESRTPRPEATRANEERAGKKDRRAAYGRPGPLRVSKERPRGWGCGAAPAGWAGAGRQVSAASAFGGDGAAPSSCGRPLALAPRPRPPPPPRPPAAAAGRAGPGPAGRSAAARCAVVALGRPRRGELGAARGRARGPVPPRPLAPQRAGPGPGLRPDPGLRRQAGQQHAPGERAPGRGAAGTVRCRPPSPRTGHLRRGDPGRGPEAAAGGGGPGAAPGRGGSRGCFVTGQAGRAFHGVLSPSCQTPGGGRFPSV